MNVKINGIVPNIASKEICYAITFYVNLCHYQKMFYYLIQSRFCGINMAIDVSNNVSLSISLQVAIVSRQSQ